MTTDEILDGLLAREGLHRAQVTRPDGTIDPETNRGITWPVFQRYYREHDLGPATREKFLALTAGEAKAIYYTLFISDPGFTRENVPYEPLRVQLIDFGVNSGPERAIRWLQRVLRIPPTGVLDQTTQRTLDDWHRVDLESQQFFDTYYGLVNDALVAARSYMIDQAVDQGIMRKQDEEGVESRALSFFLAKP